jgi:hypothetical protein
MSTFQKKQEFFEQDSELEDYEDSEILENDFELDLESDELDMSPQDLEAEEEIGQRSRVPLRPLRTRPLPLRPLRPRPQPAARRPPAYRPKPPRAIRRHPRSVSVDEPVTCICPEKTCPEHGTEYIRWVQSALNGVLGLRLPVNGVMGPETRSAVRSFQEREGLPVTGIVGPDIESALIAARSGKSPGAEATKPAVPGMPEPAEPATTSPEPDSAKPAAEFDFEWETYESDPESADLLQAESPFRDTETADWEYESALDVLSPSELKAVRITSTFETGRPGGFGGLTGNIDGQGLSFGLLNFTIKAGSLIPLLKEFINKYPRRYSAAFGKDADRFKEIVFATKPDPENPKRRIRDVDRQMAFVNNQMNSIPTKAKGNRIIEPWKTHFGRLEKDPEFRKIQVKAVRSALDRARYWYDYFGFKTERGFAFMFDLVSSHGGAWLNAKKFKGKHRALLQRMLAAKKAALGRDTLTELEKMEVIANMIADVSLEEWRARVRVRKLWFARGSGKIHGSFYDIKKDFGITDNPPDFGAVASTHPGASELAWEGAYATKTRQPAQAVEPPEPGEFKAYDEETDTVPTCENRIRTVTVWLNAFIPRDVPGLTRKVPDSGVKLDPSMAGKTMFDTFFVCGLTDQRSLSADINASSRMHSEAKIDLDKPRITYQKHRIDPSVEVNCMTGKVVCKGTSSTSPMNFSFKGVTSAKEIMIHMRGSQGPACPKSKIIKKVGQFLLNAKIDYEGTFFIKRVARNYVDIGFLGYVDLFPAYEFVAMLNDSNPIHLGGRLPAAGSSPVTHLGTRQKIHFVRRLWLKCSNGKQVAGLYERIIN